MSTDTQSIDLSSHAVDYAERGWRVVPLHDIDPTGKCSCRRASCPNPGKHPRLVNWQHEASADEAVVARWWETWPEANVGILLGPTSNLIDVECDTMEAEKSLGNMLGGPITTVTYKSTRGRHRLFSYHDDLREIDKAVVKIDGVEIRLGGGGQGAQSVFPPSRHPSGKRYEWIFPPSTHDLLPLPSVLVDRIRRQCGAGSMPIDTTDWGTLYGGVSEGGRNDAASKVAGQILAGIDCTNNSSVALNLTLFRAWNERNTPPLPDDELQSIFKSILKREVAKRAESEFADAVAKYIDVPKAAAAAEAETRGEAKQDDDWKLVIVDSKPSSYRLTSPLWGSKTERGYIELTAAQYLSPLAIRQQAFEQSRVVIGKDFAKVWDGTAKNKGYCSLLADSAEVIPAPTEEHRDRLIARDLLDHLSEPLPIDDDRPPKGPPQYVADGGIVFSFNGFYEKHCYGPEGYKMVEVSRIMSSVGVREWRKGGRGKRAIRLKHISQTGMGTLRALLAIEGHGGHEGANSE